MGKVINLNKINDNKREKVRVGMEYIDQINVREHVIDKVAVFGSCIRDDCNEESDIDICLHSPYDTKNRAFLKIYGNIEAVMDSLCDITIYRKLNDEFKKVVDNGVIVYES